MAALTALAFANTAFAGLFSVTPVRVFMAPKDRATAITIVNEGDRKERAAADRAGVLPSRLYHAAGRPAATRMRPRAVGARFGSRHVREPGQRLRPAARVHPRLGRRREARHARLRRLHPAGRQAHLRREARRWRAAWRQGEARGEPGRRDLADLRRRGTRLGAPVKLRLWALLAAPALTACALCAAAQDAKPVDGPKDR